MAAHAEGGVDHRRPLGSGAPARPGRRPGRAGPGRGVARPSAVSPAAEVAERQEHGTTPPTWTPSRPPARQPRGPVRGPGVVPAASRWRRARHRSTLRVVLLGMSGGAVGDARFAGQVPAAPLPLGPGKVSQMARSGVGSRLAPGKVRQEARVRSGPRPRPAIPSELWCAAGGAGQSCVLSPAGHLLSTVGEGLLLGAVGAPARRVPDLDPVDRADHDHVAGHRGVLPQRPGS